MKLLVAKTVLVRFDHVFQTLDPSFSICETPGEAIALLQQLSHGRMNCPNYLRRLTRATGFLLRLVLTCCKVQVRNWKKNWHRMLCQLKLRNTGTICSGCFMTISAVTCVALPQKWRNGIVERP